MIAFNFPEIDETLPKNRKNNHFIGNLSWDNEDIPVKIMKISNAEGMSDTWLTGWTLSQLFMDHSTENINLLCMSHDNGNFISGFNHAIQYKNSISEKETSIQWNYITDKKEDDDPYQFYNIHRNNIFYTSINNYQSIEKLTNQYANYANIFVSNYSESFMSVLILCLSNINSSGIAFIKICNWNEATVDGIIYCCKIAKCQLILLPWSGYYVELKNINISRFDRDYHSLLKCMDGKLMHGSINIYNKKIMDMIQSKKNESTDWLDEDHIIPLDNNKSIFSDVF